VIFDVSGLERVIGPPQVIAAEVARLSAAHGLSAQIAIAGTKIAARLLATAHAGITVVPPGEEAARLADLPLEILEAVDFRPQAPKKTKKPRPARGSLGPGAGDLESDLLQILRRWGLRTLGDLARLPAADVRTRLGESGVRIHQAASGRDAAPLVPAGDPTRFLERLELEWPIEGLEPLSFVLARLCDALSASLERADRGAVTVTTRLWLVTRIRSARGPRAAADVERTLNLPAAMRDSRVLRTLILLDLESHPPEAAIDVVEIDLGVAPGQIVQGTLLTRSLPSPETTATLLARLKALMGETRVGTPSVVDSHDERALTMTTFSPGGTRTNELPLPGDQRLVPALRRFRLPIAADVCVEHGAPVAVIPVVRGLAGGRVVTRAGPWRSSGHWWALDRRGWDRDEWEVELPDGVYRLARDRATGRWEIEGAFD
jgi:protein ImuB